MKKADNENRNVLDVVFGTFALIYVVISVFILIGVLVVFGLHGSYKLAITNFNLTIACFIGIVLLRLYYGFGLKFLPIKISVIYQRWLIIICLSIGLALVFIPDTWNIEKSSLTQIMDKLFYLSYLIVIWVMMRLYYYIATLGTIPEFLEKYAILEEKFIEKKLAEHKYYKEYRAIEFNEKYWYLPLEPDNRWNLRGFHERAFNYLNRKRYPLRLSILN
jgi:hypothetical protein